VGYAAQPGWKDFAAGWAICPEFEGANSGDFQGKIGCLPDLRPVREVINCSWSKRSFTGEGEIEMEAFVILLGLILRLVLPIVIISLIGSLIEKRFRTE
jgi:hypothetical protein